MDQSLEAVQNYLSILSRHRLEYYRVSRILFRQSSSGHISVYVAVVSLGSREPRETTATYTEICPEELWRNKILETL